MKNILIAFALLCIVASVAMAQTATPDYQALHSKLGNTTGGPCTSAQECVVGLAKGSNDTLCIAQRDMVSSGKTGPGGLKCGCLADVHHCGYAFPQPMAQ